MFLTQACGNARSQFPHFHTKTLVLSSLQGERSVGCRWRRTQHSILLLLPFFLLQHQCSSSPTLSQARQLWQNSTSSHQFSAGSGPQAAHCTAGHTAAQAAGLAQGRTEGCKGRGRPGSFKATTTKTCLKLLQSSKPGASSVRRLKVAAWQMPDLHQPLEKPQPFSTMLLRKKMLCISPVSLVLPSTYSGCKAFSAVILPIHTFAILCSTK